MQRLVTRIAIEMHDGFENWVVFIEMRCSSRLSFESILTFESLCSFIASVALYTFARRKGGRTLKNYEL